MGKIPKRTTPHLDQIQTFLTTNLGIFTVNRAKSSVLILGARAPLGIVGVSKKGIEEKVSNSITDVLS